jgi:hypothetical protein
MVPFTYEISRAFVLNGAHVIMVNRKEDQGQDAIKKIKAGVGEDAKIGYHLKEVQKVFMEIREKNERLDLVRIHHL